MDRVAVNGARMQPRDDPRLEVPLLEGVDLAVVVGMAGVSPGQRVQRRLPEPIRKIIGNLSDTENLLVGLQIRPKGGERS